jgi:hypothetical protein
MKLTQYLSVKRYIQEKSESLFLLKDLQTKFPLILPGTLRQILRRLVANQVLSHPYDRKGLYLKYLSNLTESYDIEKILETKYCLDSKGNRVGFLGGINFLNTMGLTSQTSPVIHVFSKRLSHPKRIVMFGRYRVYLIKLPKKLDLTNINLTRVIFHLSLVDHVSEYSFEKTLQLVHGYLKGQIGKLSHSQLKDLLTNVPIKTKIKAYEYGILSLETNG